MLNHVVLGQITLEENQFIVNEVKNLDRFNVLQISISNGEDCILADGNFYTDCFDVLNVNSDESDFVNHVLWVFLAVKETAKKFQNKYLLAQEYISELVLENKVISKLSIFCRNLFRRTRRHTKNSCFFENGYKDDSLIYWKYVSNIFEGTNKWNKYSSNRTLANHNTCLTNNWLVLGSGFMLSTLNQTQYAQIATNFNNLRPNPKYGTNVLKFPSLQVSFRSTIKIKIVLFVIFFFF